MTSRIWKHGILGVPAVGLSVLPKVVCPVCSPAYAALLSSLGIGFLASTRYVLPLTAVLLAAAVASLFIGAATRRGLAPFWSGVFAAGCIVLGKFVLDSAVATYAGIGMLVVASVWSAVPRRTAASYGKLAGCCAGRGPDEHVLREALR